jgi:hypothetical protein
MMCFQSIPKVGALVCKSKIISGTFWDPFPKTIAFRCVPVSLQFVIAMAGDSQGPETQEPAGE